MFSVLSHSVRCIFWCMEQSWVSKGDMRLPHEHTARRQGDLVLAAFRLTLYACAAALAGTLGFVAYRIVTGV